VLAFLRKVSFVRIAVLALLFLGANTLAAWTMSVPTEATSSMSHHHCDASSRSHSDPAQTKHHSNSCPCCHEGCLCFHACGAAVPELLTLRSVSPATKMSSGYSVTPLAAPDGELLRPPIA
jgi:hypothetical protein